MDIFTDKKKLLTEIHRLDNLVRDYSTRIEIANRARWSAESEVEKLEAKQHKYTVTLKLPKGTKIIAGG